MSLSLRLETPDAYPKTIAGPFTITDDDLLPIWRLVDCYVELYEWDGRRAFTCKYTLARALVTLRGKSTFDPPTLNAYVPDAIQFLERWVAAIEEWPGAIIRVSR